MNSLFEPATLQEMNRRIDSLKPDSQSQWGKMNVAQMLAHCGNALEVTAGDKSPKSTLMGKLLGRFVKSVITSEKPFKPNIPTDPSFLILDSREFDKEKQRLKTLLARVSTDGPQALQNRRHPFFGPLTPEEWSNLTVKHLDHHLRQFGA